MYRTKQNVDKHVTNVLSRLKDEKERNAKGYHVARLYYDIKEYETARKYLAGFLSINEKFAPAHKLLGQLLEGLCRTEKAIESYKRSYELDDRQKDVLLKICELYCEVDLDTDRAKYWADKAEKLFPKNDIVFRLRERICTDGDGVGNVEELEDLIASELAKQPGDPILRSKLLKLYLETGRVNEAYTHAVEVESKLAYPDSLDWYQCLLEVFEAYAEYGGNEGTAFHQNLLAAQNALVALSLEKAKVSDCAEVLHKFDQSLHTASRQKAVDAESKVFIEEMQAQFYAHAGTLLLKRAQLDHLGWTDARNMSGACYLASYATAPFDTHAPWYVKASQAEKRIHINLYNMACYRASQAGHMVSNVAVGDRQKWKQMIKQDLLSSQGCEKIFDSLFTMRQMKGTKETSFLMKNNMFTSFTPQLPNENDLKQYDIAARRYKSNRLHVQVWLCLQYYSFRDDTQPFYGETVFDDLQYSTALLDTAAPETLCQLDIQAFLYAVVRCTAVRLEAKDRIVPSSSGQPTMFPASLNEALCTPEQAEWWTTTYKLYKNIAKEQLAKCRLTLQRGLEAVRLVGNHGVATALVIHFAKTFEEQVQDMKSRCVSGYSMDVAEVERRAAHYWNIASQMLTRANVGGAVPKTCLFKYEGAALSDEEIQAYLDEGRYFMACQAMDAGCCEEAIVEFSKLKTADAAYHAAQMYRSLAEEELVEASRNDVQDAVGIEQHTALLEKARDSLYICLDRIGPNRHHRLNSVLASDIDEVEAKLNRMGLSPGTSAPDPPADELSSRVTPLKLTSKFSSTIKHSTPSIARHSLNFSLNAANLAASEHPHIAPSPERLDAQLRALASSNDAILKRNEELVATNSSLIGEVKQLHVIIKKLEDKIDNFETQEKVKAEAARLVEAAGAATALSAATSIPAVAMVSSISGHVTPHGTPRPHLTPVRHLPTHPPGSPYYGYRPPEYDYPPYYPMYAPPPQPPLAAPYGYPAPAPAPPPAPAPVPAVPHALYKPPPAHQSLTGDHHAEAQVDVEDEDDYYYEDDDEADTNDENGVYNHHQRAAAAYHIPESQLIQDWPYGSSVGMEGKSTLTYAPGTPATVPPHASYFPQIPPQQGLPGIYGQPPPAVTTPPMPGPGYFSSPERPVPTYGARYPAAPACAVQAAAGAAGVSVTMPLEPPKPGFVSITQPGRGTAVVAAPGMPAATSLVASTAATSLPPASAARSPITPMFKPGDKEPEGGTSPTVKPATAFPIKFPTNPVPVIHNEEAKSIIQCAQPEDADEDEVNEDSYQGPDFEPIIPLPAEVVVETGEEDEIVMFVSRAKLYRFTENQWKERGLGDLKILFNDKTGQARIVMRREQVLKVCANHGIHEGMTVDFKAPSDRRVLNWVATDFSEGEAVMEKFCVRFKTDDLGADFKENFDAAVKKVTESAKTIPARPAAPAAVEAKDDLFAKFKPKTGSWECSGCYVSNGPDVLVCPACATLKPGTKVSTSATTSTASSITSAAGGGFKFGGAAPSATSGFKFGSPVSATATPTGFGSSTATPTGFGTSTATPTGFGASTATPTGFGASTATPTGFGASTATPTGPGTSTATPTGFGKSTATPAGFGKSTAKPAGFGTSTATPTGFGTSTATPTGFGTSTATPAGFGTSTAKPAGIGSSTATTAGLGTSTPSGFGGVTSKPAATFGTSAPTGFGSAGQKTATTTPFMFGSPSVAPTGGSAFGISKPTEKVDVRKPEGITAQADSTSSTLPSVFQDKPGTWECDVCRVYNDPDDMVCVACEKPNPNSKPADALKPAVSASGIGSFKFGSPAASTATFGSPSIFGNTPSTTTAAPKSVISPPKFQIGGAVTTSAPVFGVTSSAAATTTASRSIFSSVQPASSTVASKPVFGSSTPVFGGITPLPAPTSSSTAKPSFGGSTSVFGTTATTTTTTTAQGVFGGSAPVFGTAVTTSAPTAPTTVKPLFGTGLSAASTSATTTTSSSGTFVFGGTSTTPVFGQSGTTTKPASAFSFASVKFGETSATSAPASDLLKSFAEKSKETSSDTKAADSTSKDAKPKPTVGGFRFNATPVFQDDGAVARATIKASPHKDVTPPTEEKKNPFASFSFSPTKPEASGAAATKASEKLMFGTSTDGAASFASLAANTDSSKSPSFAKKSDFAGFSGAGQQIFRSPGKSEGGEEHVEEYEPEVDFKPIVPLPDLVEVRTGEEEEDKLFCQRARLYRHDPDAKQWKERGVGEIKILKNPQTGRCRILMRREQVLKLCANHPITTDMILKPMTTSEKAWCWVAQDYSEEEMKTENLAIRFKTIDVAKKFKEVFEDCQKAMKEAPIQAEIPVSVEEQGAEKASESTKKGGFGDKFKPMTGSWECQGCYVQNAGNVNKCPACNTARPSAVPDAAKPKPSHVKPKADSATGGFGEKFKPKSGDWECQGCYIQNAGSVDRCPACDTARPGGAAKAPEAPKPKPVSVKSNAETVTGGFGDKFKPTTGSWECQGCYIQNAGSVTQCPACNTLKPGAKLPQSSEVTSSTTSGAGFGTFKFGASGSGFTFGTPPKPASKASGFTFGTPSSVDSKLTGGFTFGTPSQASTASSFGSPAKPETEKPKPDTTSVTTTKPGLFMDSPKVGQPSTGFNFGMSTSGFNFTPTKPTDNTPLDLSQPKSPQSPGEDGYYVHDEGEHITFEPLVTLEKVDVKTGEEDETVLYSHRAKLFRFVNSEWKERGIGDVKILQHKESHKSRVVMRREQILKLCLNHVVTADLELKEMANAQGKAWVWHAEDFAEGEGSHEKFAIKFRSKEVADEFHEAFENAKTGAVGSHDSSKDLETSQTDQAAAKDSKPGADSSMQNFSFKLEDSKSESPAVSGFASSTPAADTSATFGTAKGFTFAGDQSKMTPASGGDRSVDSAQSPHTRARSLLMALLDQPAGSDDDVIIVGEEKPTAANQEKAKQFQLPCNFYSYEDKPSCPGCIGCADEDTEVIFVKEEIPSDEKIALAEKYQLPRSFYLYEGRTPCRGCIGCEEEDLVAQGIAQKKDSARKPKKSSEATPSSSQEATAKEFGAQPDSTTSEPIIAFGKPGTNDMSFAALSCQGGGAFAFGKKPGADGDKPFSFAGAGSSIFGQANASATEDGEDGDVAPSHDIHFEPLVDLPEVEVKTGEEDEMVLYSHRAKLFRFTNNEWKERGIGEIKLLRHAETGKIRVLMRREQIHKIACNHQLSTEMLLKPLTCSEVSYCWNALDFAGNEPKYEQFAIKFKTKDVAQKFKEKFEECQQEIANLSISVKVGDTSTHSDDSEEEDNITGMSAASLANASYADVVAGRAAESDGGFRSLEAHIVSECGDSSIPISVESEIVAEPAYMTGDAGNPYYTAELNSAVDSPISPEVAYVTGDHGNPYYAEELSRSGSYFGEDVITTENEYYTGDAEEAYQTEDSDSERTDYFRSLEAHISEEETHGGSRDMSESTEMIVPETVNYTGDAGNPFYAEELNRAGERSRNYVETHESNLVTAYTIVGGQYEPVEDADQEETIEATTAYTTGNLGNIYYAAELGLKPSGESIQQLVEEQLRESASYVQGVPAEGEETEENAVGASAGDAAGGGEAAGETSNADEEQGDEDDEEDEDDDEENLFSKRGTVMYVDGNQFVTLGMGELRVQYDDDVNGTRIRMLSDTGKKLINHIICINYSVQTNEKKHFCEWTAKDFSTNEGVRRTFHVVFSSAQAVKEFQAAFCQGHEMAVDSGLKEVDDIPSEIVVPEICGVAKEEEDFMLKK